MAPTELKTVVRCMNPERPQICGAAVALLESLAAAWLRNSGFGGLPSGGDASNSGRHWSYNCRSACFTMMYSRIANEAWSEPSDNVS